ncbi:MAG: DNA-binding response regulator [Symbiobacterium thermophilum]|uniref:Stage 0 sporulation protein A homolog n=2 Tax=Symbiobacterium thermophilum TaxID=2734 RepID=Q67QN5_SYMTH|nr:DNA-binding response regulator [Symbiobacterium thermophilum]BAD40008.1 two-component response regulator [Symbiobacterium thermophilum IAM 14863]
MDAVKRRILLVEDQTVVREGLRQLIESDADMEVVGEAAAVAEAVALAARLRPDVVLLDLKLADGSGLDAARQILQGSDPPAVLVLSTYADAALVRSALAMGASGYIPKTASFAEIASAVRTAAQGGVVIHPSLAGKLAGRGEETLREEEIAMLRMLAEGASYAEIGNRLYLSERTVRRHMNLLFDKMGVQNRTQAVAEAMRRGLLN